MYRELFDQELQERMQSFFAEDLSKFGTIKKLKKNTIIDPFDAENIFIVIEGQCTQSLISADGIERSFFRLTRGTIFGEMDYFEGHRTCVITHVDKDSTVSIINKTTLEEELGKRPEIYRYFLHSIVRKYRLLMMQSADSRFNDSIGQISSALVRIAAMQEGGTLENHTKIEYKYTHEELARNMGISRTTVTCGLNYLKDKGLISTNGRNIIIENVSELQSFINSYW